MIKHQSVSLLIVTLFLFIQKSQEEINQRTKFNTFPDYTIQTFMTIGTVVRISPDEDMIIVGYANGNVKTYSMYGTYLVDFSYHHSAIIDIVWLPKLGPVTLDNSGHAVRWNKDGHILFKWTFSGKNITGMAYTTGIIDGLPSFYLGFNQQLGIIEWQLPLTLNSTINEYVLKNGNKITSFVYGFNYTNLFVTQNQSIISQYDCVSTKLTGNKYTFNESIKQMQIIDNKSLIVLSEDRKLHKFNEFPSEPIHQCTFFIQHTELNYTSDILVTCPQSNFIILNRINQKQMDVYKSDNISFQYVQTLSYMSSPVKSIDCSKEYLVSIDDQGFIAINTYEQYVPPYVPSVNDWVSYLQILGVLVFLIVLIFICCRICCRRKVEINNYYNVIGTQNSRAKQKSQVTDSQNIRNSYSKSNLASSISDDENSKSLNQNPYRKSLIGTTTNKH